MFYLVTPLSYQEVGTHLYVAGQYWTLETISDCNFHTSDVRLFWELTKMQNPRLYLGVH